MKKNRKEEDEEIRRAKANIRTGFIIAVIVIALLAVIAFVMVGLMSAVTSFPDMGTSVIPDANTIISKYKKLGRREPAELFSAISISNFPSFRASPYRRFRQLCDTSA